MDLKIIIAKLLIAGDNLTDGASTCGHDVEVEYWEKIAKKARKEIGSDFIDSYQEEERSREEQKSIRKAKKFDESHISVDEFFNL
jgi:hypothetical protein